MRQVSRVSYDMSQICQEKGYREHCTICRKFVGKRGIESIARYVANLTGKRSATSIESIASIVANLTGNRSTTGIESITSIVANLTGKKSATGIESIVSIVANLIANLTGNRSATGIESIASIVANLTRKGVGIPRLLGKQAPILETVYYCSSLAIL
jgi:Ni,Fe-hydrogenase III large subunit